MNRLLFAFLLLTAAPLCPAATFTWTGTVNGQWTSGLNWGQISTVLVPDADDLLVFPAGVTNKTMTNGYPANSNFWRMEFRDAGYTLGGNRLVLNATAGGIAMLDVTHIDGTTTISAPLVMGPASAALVMLRTSGIASTLRLAAGAAPDINDKPLELNAAGLGSRIDLEAVLGGTTPEQVTITGAGQVRFLAAQSGAQAVGVSGNLVLNNFMNGPLVVQTTGTLSGTGQVNGTTTIHGFLDPGDGFGEAESMTFGGTVTFGTGAPDAVLFDMKQTGQDQLVLQGTAGLNTNGATVHLRVADTYASSIGQSWVLIDKRSPGAINATDPFVAPDGNKIVEGSVLVLGPRVFRFSYTGGDGNDFTVTRTTPPSSSGTREWDGGGGADGLFSNAANWADNTLPVATNTLIFGVTAPNRSPLLGVMNSPGYYALSFTAASYLLAGDGVADRLLLHGGIATSHAAGINEISMDYLELTGPQTFAVNGAGGLVVGSQIHSPNYALTVNTAHASGFLELQDVVDVADLTKNGPGRLDLSGSERVAFPTVTVNRGELRSSRADSPTVLWLALVIGDGTNTASYVSTAAGNGVLRASTQVTVNANGSFRPRQDFIAGLTLNGGTVNTETSTLTLNDDLTANASASISGSQIAFDHTTPFLSVGSGAVLTVSAAIGHTGTATQFTKSGAGTLRFDNTFTAPQVNVTGGTLDADGTTTAQVQLSQASAILAGNGQVGAVLSTNSQSRVWPGGSTAGSTGSSLATGNLSFQNNFAPRLVFNLRATAAQCDRLDVQGTVTLASASLELLQLTSPPPPGTEITLIANDGTDAVSGTFTGYPQGANIVLANARYAISYNGGTGNDVVLTAVALPTGPPVIGSFSVSPATPGNPSRITATVLGPALISVQLEASTDLGGADDWQAIHTFYLNSSGVGTILNIPDAAGVPQNFWRFRYP